MNHSFIDGNKRISFFAADIFLRLNGYYISCDSEEANQFFMENPEDNKFRFEIIKSWLKGKIKKVNR